MNYSISFGNLNGSLRRTVHCVLVMLGLALVGALGQGCASIDQQKAFATPEEATQALVAALRANDTAALSEIFGAEGDPIISSGDKVADQNGFATFLGLYDEKHELVGEKDSKTLQIGKAEWPFPIPLVLEEKGWVFDTESGKEEILNRRIGRNELATIQVCLAGVDAQREYAMKDRDNNGLHEYALRFMSEPGTKNGLYWETKEGEPASPLGAFVSRAAEEGYTRGAEGEPVPYHGYYYRILTSQGPNAPGGEFDYLINGKLVGGFAIVAYPAEYGNSGVMTFIVNHQGIVYQRDLGADTKSIAKAMKAYDPGPEWKKAE